MNVKCPQIITKITSILLIVSLVVIMMPSSYVNADENWDGVTTTEITPTGQVYEIGTAAELAWFAKKVSDGTLSSSNAKLTADIDLNNREWAGFVIGNSTNTYKGTFDGNNHNIENMLLTATSAQQGLFGKNEGTVKSIGNLTGNVISTVNQTGGVVGWNAGAGTVSECNSSIFFSSTTTSPRLYGGIAGQNNGLIEKSLFSGTITVLSSGAQKIGGITGSNLVGGVVRGCVNDGIMKSHNGTSGAEVGGIAGRNEAQLFNCYNRGTLSCGNDATNIKLGGIVGTLNSDNAYLFNCYNSGILTGGAVAYVGGICANKSTSNSPKASNNYYILGTDSANSNLISEETLASNTLVNGLNGDNSYEIQVGDDIKYIKGTVSPILSWQANTSPQEPDPDHVLYLENVIKAYEWQNTLIPTYGSDDNIVDFLKKDIAAKGFENVHVKLTETSDESYISSNGAIEYYYNHPDTLSSIMYKKSAYVRVGFELSYGTATANMNKQANLYWDIGKLNNAIKETIVDNLDDDAIKNSNESLSDVKKDLTLPRYIGNKRWAEISWSSSDSDILKIEDNKGSLEEQMYGPKTGKVLRATDDRRVKLTAKIKYNFTNNDVEVAQTTTTKSFDITVSALASDIEEYMQKDLNENYTAEKLKYSISGSAIDPDNVVGDIQLLIPSKTGVPNYGKYTFSVTSSSMDVDIQSYRANVFRPLPSDSEKEVTLRVTMKHKEVNASVSKDIRIKLTPLTREEIDHEIALMEKVKAAFFEGIRGENLSASNITSNLVAFKEVNMTGDNQLNWVYDNSNRTNRGIIPVDIDLSRPSEAWNLFKSSNNGVITHENLLYTKPEYNTSVTIESCLSSAVYGKYALRYPNNEDFKKLYRQPVCVVLNVTGEKSIVSVIPGVPTGLKVLSSSYNSTKLTWEKAGDANAYEVYRSVSKNGEYTLIDTVGQLSFTDKKLKCGTEYYYKIKSVNEKNKSEFSTVVSAKPSLSKNKIKKIKAKKKSVTLKWTKTNGAQKYEVYRSNKKKGKYKKIATVSGRKTKYINKKLKKNKKYFYKVRSYRMEDKKKVCSPFSSVVSVRIK